MVRRATKTYLIKRGSKRIEIEKGALKIRNLAIVAEFKTASKERRGELLREYFDLNRSFVTYFPKFHEDYREEIINTFVCLIPDFFDRFDSKKNVDVNSYLAMYAKKNAVRDFLMDLQTIRHNKAYRGPDGKTVYERPVMVSMDAGFHSYDGGCDDEVFHEDRNLTAALMESRLNESPQDSYSVHFDGELRDIVRDFEGGMSWREIQRKRRMRPDKFAAMVCAIRMQLKRIMKEDRKNVRKCVRPARPKRSRGPIRRFAPQDFYELWGGEGQASFRGSRAYREAEADFGGAEAQENEGPFLMEGGGPEDYFEGEGA